MPPPSSPAVASALLAHRSAFKAFLVSRVGNEADADDLLQNGLIKALQRADELKNGEKSVAWFYQILRNVIIDHARSRNATRRREEAWTTDAVTLADDADAERFRALVGKRRFVEGFAGRHPIASTLPILDVQ